MPECDGSNGYDCGNRLYMAECSPTCSRYWGRENAPRVNGSELVGFDGEAGWESSETIVEAPRDGDPKPGEVVIRPSRDLQGKRVWQARDSETATTYAWPEADFLARHLPDILFRMTQLPQSKRVKIILIPWEE
jgi:hypothetical protein